MKVVFSDSEYRWTYGHAPKGRGYWAFLIGDDVFFANGTLTEAKVACVKYVRSHYHDDDVITVRVGT